MNEYDEENYLQISGIQHFSFCRRQWALIHVEHQWKENLRTVEGELLHDRVHNEDSFEKRGDLLTVRGMIISSRRLGVSGKCDVVEFRSSNDGIPLFGREGKWLPYPVEYKRGQPKSEDADRLQLCCQAMCLETMLAVDIPEGAIFYGEPRRREKISFSKVLRDEVCSMLEEMHKYANRGYTPKVKTGLFCKACSLNDLCLPQLCKNHSATEYVKHRLWENA
jgi:CRISPR-associated exonuclease Cas4